MKFRCTINSRFSFNLTGSLIAIKKKRLFILSIVAVSLTSCCYNNSTVLLKIKVEEQVGLNRPLEYIEIILPRVETYQEGDKIYAYSIDEGKQIGVQVIEKKKEIQIVFPITIKENETKEYIIKVESDKNIETHTDLNVLGEKLDVMIENKYFSASFKEFIGYKEEKLSSGHLGSISLKEFGNIILERKDPNLKMHWGPNFGKENLNYRTMAHLTSPDSCFTSTKGPYYFSLFRRGHIEGYEKIWLQGEYKFYAGLPYFVFSSEMIFTDDDSLNLLRNDEMTMDSLFTNVVFPKSNGEIIDLLLYDESEMAYLDGNPITDDASWLFFYNKSKSYAFGSIRLHYDNTNLYGGDSPIERSHTKITSSTNSGRYWNRRLINSKNTFVPKGSKYKEKNAYIVFKADKNDPAKTIEYFYKCLKHPVKISYEPYL
ncbi:hypothetical protein [Flavivirga spongiicola]|uniref:DUF4861 domain-containing protein n=1 Tax=Flavivirga spongiicola TaxID=421621 RepID=A0ABU7XXT3_9FLAO|nr:hypothetical protein [Flavivirga sp. MEBiC05379]MDO5980604.1 hypothetical protein [Flavivirga sp. MEBiC05379]